MKYPLQLRNTRSQDGEHVWKTVDAGGGTYWSGLDAKVYANDVFLDDLVTLQYEVQEAVLPIYSYADYTFRSLARGARRVQGAFVINFRRDAYLFELLRLLSKPVTTNTAAKKAEDTRARALAQTGTATAEDFLGLVSPGGKETSSGKFAVDHELVRRAHKEFAEALWGTKTLTGPLTPVQQDVINRMGRNRPRFEVPGGFDLRIAFGSANQSLEPGAERQMQNNGEFHNVPSSAQVRTSSRIVGVELTGITKVLDDSGRPVLETYSFLANDVY